MEVIEANILALVTYSHVRIMTAVKNKGSCTMVIIAGLVVPKNKPNGLLRMDNEVNILQPYFKRNVAIKLDKTEL